MGMFNSIYADLLCPDKQEIGKDTEIQINMTIGSVRTTFVELAQNIQKTTRAVHILKLMTKKGIMFLLELKKPGSD